MAYQGSALQIAFGLLVVEVILCVLIILPLPLTFRKRVLLTIDQLTSNQTVTIILRTFFGILFLFFCDSLRSVESAEGKIEQHNDHGHFHSTHSDLNSRKFRSQRNSYLFGSILFLFLMIYRLKEMMKELHKLEEKSGVVLSQQKNASSEYDRVSTERDKFKTEYEAANNKATELEARVSKLTKSEAAIRTQAENQQKQFDRILEENDQLHKAANAKTTQSKKDE
eukprot:TRINITY_DN3297_c0_g1_i1.p1 TRINITY_DN3297_c0_g1~~TRINITY_DN3297_c0_g1_i1.p1  ORF type:complete len:225 (+),score=49.39 TRINITY_DN3297_c0_g1_i1:77-751(+)